jgi:hypothetical protein
MEATPDLSMTAPPAEEAGLIMLQARPNEGTLVEIDTVDERLAASSDLVAHLRGHYGTRLAGHLAMIERINVRERRDGYLGRSTVEARERLYQRVGELTDVIGLLLAEQHAEIDGARRHLGWARQSARIDAHVAGRARLDAAGLVGVA